MFLYAMLFSWIGITGKPCERSPVPAPGTGTLQAARAGYSGSTA